MRKGVFMLVLTGILFFAAAGTSAVAFGAGQESGKGSPGFVVDGKRVVFDETQGLSYISDTGRTMLPVRACLESIGCGVEWNGEEKTVFTYKGNTQVEIPIGKEEIYIDQRRVPTDAAAVNKNGRTFLPLRAVLEAYGYRVDWDEKAGVVYATSPGRLALSPYNINGGTTGVFSRKQLDFTGFTGIEGDITLPVVTMHDQRECPYVYFGFDWADDAVNAEGGFQLSRDQNNPDRYYWEVFLRQGLSWQWGEDIFLEQGSTHHLKFYSEAVSDRQTDLVIELDGREVVRKASAVTDFSDASVKAVIAMAMSEPFDGTNCRSISKGAKIANLKVLEWGADRYADFDDYALYSEWKPAAGAHGMWFGTVDCIPSWLHYGKDGTLSIYNERLPYEQKSLATAVTKRESVIPGNVAVTNEHIYYEDEKGQIIQALLADPAVIKVVYQLPVWSYGNGEFVYSSLYVENGTAYLKYHQGGAVMGADYLIRLNGDGTAEELQNSYHEVKILGDKVFTRWVGPMPGPGNLAMITEGGESRKIGNPEYLYTWEWMPDGSTGGGYGPDDIYLRGDHLYILAINYEQYRNKAVTAPEIHRIDLKTGETVRVGDREVTEFVLEGEYLYYQNNGTFYRLSLKNGREETVGNVNPDNSESFPGVENFLVLKGKIYWQNRADHSLYNISGNKLNNGVISGYRASVLDSMAIMGDSGEYLVCTFEDLGSEYRIIVFDRGGNVVFKSFDKAYCRNISIFGDRIYFYNLTTGTVCVGQLNK